MHSWKRLGMVLLGAMVWGVAMAQNEVAETVDPGLMRSAGKIYVVMAVVLTILAGLVTYLVRLDRKISKLEREG